MASLKVSFLLFPFLDICSRYNFLLYCGFLLPDLCFCSNLIIFQVPTRISYWHYFPKLWVLINTNLSPEIDIWNVLWFLGGHTLVNVWFLTFLNTIPFVWKKSYILDPLFLMSPLKNSNLNAHLMLAITSLSGNDVVTITFRSPCCACWTIFFKRNDCQVMFRTRASFPLECCYHQFYHFLTGGRD